MTSKILEYSDDVIDELNENQLHDIRNDIKFLDRSKYTKDIEYDIYQFTFKYKFSTNFNAIEIANQNFNNFYRFMQKSLFKHSKFHQLPRTISYIDTAGTRGGYVPINQVARDAHHHGIIIPHPSTNTIMEKFLTGGVIDTIPYIQSSKIEKLYGDYNIIKWLRYYAKFYKMHPNSIYTLGPIEYPRIYMHVSSPPHLYT